MTYEMQTSIERSVSCYGIGAHSGAVTHLTLKSAAEDVGIVFVRTDVKSKNNRIRASYLNVQNTTLCTSISNEYKVEVSTIEHLMAALWGCGVDNIIVELDGPEVPIMDGSSKPFVFMLECAGKKIQNAKRKRLKILKTVQVIHKDCEIIAEPSDVFKIDLTIEYASKVIGKQNFVLNDQISFKEEIADARTFGFLRELEYLRNQGLGKGSSLDNAIGIDNNDAIMNEGGHKSLRHKDEFVRHKLLDLAGDLYTIGGPIMGSICGQKTGHTINNQFLRQLFSDPYAYQWV
jgi:UDP-3-O-[3-hydroxymyristoyl] N-acetylglucosamine deacetylase